MTRKQYFEINHYTRLTRWFIAFSIINLALGYWGVSSPIWWLPAAIPAAAVVVIRRQGNRAYRAFMRMVDEINWTPEGTDRSDPAPRE